MVAGMEGYRYEPEKFNLSGLTPMTSLEVGPPRIAWRDHV